MGTVFPTYLQPALQHWKVRAEASPGLKHLKIATTPPPKKKQTNQEVPFLMFRYLAGWAPP